MTDLQTLTLAYYLPHALAFAQALGAVWLVVFARFALEAFA